MAPTTNVTYSSVFSQGVKMIIHSHAVYPTDLSVEKVLSHRAETTVRILGVITNCSTEVRSLTPTERECLFISEDSLKYIFS